MKCLLIYDIPDDKARTKIANFCLDYGLDRVQYSAFVGDLSTNHREELLLKIGKRLGKAAGRIELIPICRADWSQRLTICQGMDETQRPGAPTAQSKATPAAQDDLCLAHEPTQDAAVETENPPW